MQITSNKKSIDHCEWKVEIISQKTKVITFWKFYLILQFKNSKLRANRDECPIIAFINYLIGIISINSKQ